MESCPGPRSEAQPTGLQFPEGPAPRCPSAPSLLLAMHSGDCSSSWAPPTHIHAAAAAMPLLGKEALRGCEGNKHSANYCLNKKNNKNTFICMSACIKKHNSANIFVYSQREHRSELSDSGVGSACWEGRGEKVKKGLYASIAKQLCKIRWEKLKCSHTLIS